MFAILVCIAIGLGLFFAFQLMKYLHGNNYKDWKPLLFSKKDTFESIFCIRHKEDRNGCRDKNKQRTDINK